MSYLTDAQLQRIAQATQRDQVPSVAIVALLVEELLTWRMDPAQRWGITFVTYPPDGRYDIGSIGDSKRALLVFERVAPYLEPSFIRLRLTEVFDLIALLKRNEAFLRSLLPDPQKDAMNENEYAAMRVALDEERQRRLAESAFGRALAELVPLEMLVIHRAGGPSDADWQRATDPTLLDRIISHGDVLLYSDAPSNLLGPIVRSIATLAFLPGGYTMMAQHFNAGRGPDDVVSPLWLAAHLT